MISVFKCMYLFLNTAIYILSKIYTQVSVSNTDICIWNKDIYILNTDICFSNEIFLFVM